MLHITGNAVDVNSWVWDWMTENTHFKAPASELLHALPVSLPLKVLFSYIMNLSCLITTCKC